ncbi:inositol polyphosphate phosphatase [Russula aff. rugulosa BPL654]|nr:inositol polyphosphate phosphatase [Russula aff. rugulosa BPL654]
MTTPAADPISDRLLVQIASYNTALQGFRGVPQDLVDWLSPTLKVSKFLSRQPRAPDIVAVGFQELLPLHQGSVSLVAQVVNVGVALLVYALDDGVSRHVRDVQTQWTGCGPVYIGNKGAVGVRFRVQSKDGGLGEVYTFVCAHLTAHDYNLASRIADYHHIVGSLLFPPLPGSDSGAPTTMYSTSHLFFLGDLNFRLDLPPTSPFAGRASVQRIEAALDTQSGRDELKEFDQLRQERAKNAIFHGLQEAEFWSFKCTYKYEIGEVDKYSGERTPAWTDRILYATYSDSPDITDGSGITSLLYTSIPSYTTSDHKPIVSLLLLPSPTRAHTPDNAIPLLSVPHYFTPKPAAFVSLKRCVGRTLDRIIGFAWSALVLIGAGYTVVGICNFVLGLGAWTWLRSKQGNGSADV